MQWHGNGEKRKSGKIAQMGVFVALAMIFSYVEGMIPFDFGLPGVKLGIANIVVVASLYLFSTGEAFLISLVRIFLMGFLFGNGMSLVYSLAGGILSFLVMWLAKKTDWFSVTGVSIAGGVSHNIGQLAAAAVMLHNIQVAGYLPALLAAGTGTGALVGLLGDRLIKTEKLLL